jgi:hypothetical protein
MTLSQAMRYPFQGRGWFQRVLTLAIVQLIPVIGQIILVGYGMEVVRAIHAKERDLPRIMWQKCLRDGLRFVVAGVLYLAPMLGVVPMILSISRGANILVLLGSVVFAMIIVPMVGRLPIANKVIKRLAGGLVFLLPILAIALTLTNLAPSPDRPIDNGVTFNTFGVVILVAVSIAIFLILMALHIGGLRYAVEYRGLFDPPGNIRLLFKNRTSAITLVLNIIILGIIALIGIGVGLTLLILPGLFVGVVCSLAGWSLFVEFGKEVGITT